MVRPRIGRLVYVTYIITRNLLSNITVVFINRLSIFVKFQTRKHFDMNLIRKIITRLRLELI